MPHTKLVIGFAPLLDCAPLVAAAAKGHAAQEGLELSLVRETSWASIRDRVIVGHFDAAHMLGPMSIASTLGIGHLKVAMIAPMALGLGGNAITVCAGLHNDMQRSGMTPEAGPRAQGDALRRVIADRRARGEPALTLAMVYPFSAHNYELRYWLDACGIDPDTDVQLVVIPPPLLVDAMRCGQVDAELAALLAEPRHIGTASEVLHRTLSGRLRFAPQADPVYVADFYTPAKYCANFPWKSHALWFYSQMVRWRQIAGSAADAMAARDTYRPELYRTALASLDAEVPDVDSRMEQGFFDQRRFDPEQLND